MNFKIARKDFLKCVTAASRASGSSRLMDILKHSLLVAQNGSLTVCTTDLELLAEVSSDVEDLTAGSCTVPTDKLLAFLKADSSDSISVEGTSSDRVSFVTDISTVTLPSLSAEEFPVNRSAVNYWFDVPAEQFLADLGRASQGALRRSKFGSAKPVLETVLVRTGNGFLTLLATDQRIIVRIKRPCEAEERAVCVMPSLPKLAPAIIKSDHLTAACGGEKEALVSLQGENEKLVARVYEGEYPNVDAVFDANNPHDGSALFDRKKLAEALAILATVLAGSTVPTFSMEISNDACELKAHNPREGAADVRVPCLGDASTVNSSFQFYWQLQYANRALSMLDCYEEIKICWQTPLNPIYLSGAEDTSVEVLIMPVKPSRSESEGEQ